MKKKGFRVKGLATSLIAISFLVFALLYPIPYTLYPVHAQSPQCAGGGISRATGLVTTPIIGSDSKFYTSGEGGCSIDPKIGFIPYKIPTYDELKSIYYNRAPFGTNKVEITGNATQANLNFTTDSVYLITGDLNLSGNPPGAAVKTGVVFVEGKLNITSNYTYGANQADRGSVFIVKDDVNFTPSGSLTDIQATIISSGIICTASNDFTSTCPSSGFISVSPANQLNIYGSLISLDSNKPIRFRRSLGAADANTAAEKVNLEPKYLVLLRNVLSTTFQKWSEVTTPSFTLPIPPSGPIPTSPPFPSSGLVAYYKMDESSGATVADSTTNNNTGISNSSANIGTGRIGKSRTFNGTSEYIDIPVPSTSSLNLTSTVTLSAWVNPTNVNNTRQEIFSRGYCDCQAGGSGYGMNLGLNSNAKFNIGGMAGGNLDGTTDAVNGRWYHVVSITNGANSELWINGVKEITTNISVAGGSTSIAAKIGAVFGSVGPNPINLFKGSIDEVGVWNRSLTSSEIATLYNYGFGFTYGTTSAPPATTIPDAPTSLSSTPGNAQATLNWTAPASDGGAAITNYKIYRATSSGAQGSTPIATIGNVLTYLDSSPPLVNDTIYYYKVSAVNSIGEGPKGNESSATPSAPQSPPNTPTQLTATSVSSTQINLSWTAPTTGGPPTTYKILRCSGSTVCTPTAPEIDTVTAPTVTYNNTSLTCNNGYTYAVVASNSGGDSAISSRAAAALACPSSTSIVYGDASSGGSQSSIIIGADGFPVVVYASTGYRLKILKCGNTSCSAGNIVRTPSNEAIYHSIAIGTDNNPVIAYTEAPYPNNYLKVGHCIDASCSNWNVSIVDSGSGDFTGYYPTITKSSSGLPMIGYYQQPGQNQNLKFAQCANNDCSSRTINTVASGNGSGGAGNGLIKGSNGNPVIAYSANVLGQNKLAVCADANCSSSTINTIDTSANFSLIFNSVAISTDTFPIIAYVENGGTVLKVAKCTNASCSAKTITVVDSSGSFNGTSMAILPSTGFPVIAYFDLPSQSLKVLKCGNTNCSSGNTISFVDGGKVGVFSSSPYFMAIGTDGFPVISYLDNVAWKLKIAKCSNGACN